MITLKNISKNFSESGLVLDSIDLFIKAGEFVTILGSSGCGKSTLLRIISGLEHVSQGEIMVDNPSRDLFQSFVFQEAQLLPWRSVLQNTMLPLELKGITSSHSAEKVLESVGLSESINLLPRQLSGGMKMRVSLARALVTEPSLLLLDEPFSALDEVIRFKLQEDLRSIWVKNKMTTIFVTHSVSEAVFLSNRILVMSPKPGHILLNKEINLNETRTNDLRSQNSYLNLVQELSSFLRQVA